MKKSIFTLLFFSFFATTLWAQQPKIKENTNSISKEETQKENQIIVAKYFEYLFKTGDFESMRKIIAKDAVYSQAKGLPYGGTYVGINEWLKMYAKAQPYFDLRIEKEPIFYTNAVDNDIMLSFTIKCKAKTSGKEIIMPISEYFELKDGLITAIRAFYFDTKTFSDFIK